MHALQAEVAGSLTGDLFACGEFHHAGDVAAARIARFDRTAWHALGQGFDGPGHAVAKLLGGDLVVVGNFSIAGGASAKNIAWWGGAAYGPHLARVWPVAFGAPDEAVHSLLVLADGSLLAGGDFQSYGGLTRWDGSAWATCHGTNGVVRALDQQPNGSVAIGGQFTMIRATPAVSSAIFDGTGWQLPTFTANSNVYSLAAALNGVLFIGGELFGAGSWLVRAVERFGRDTARSRGHDAGQREFASLHQRRRVDSQRRVQRSLGSHPMSAATSSSLFAHCRKSNRSLPGRLAFQMIMAFATDPDQLAQAPGK